MKPFRVSLEDGDILDRTHSHRDACRPCRDVRPRSSGNTLIYVCYISYGFISGWKAFGLITAIAWGTVTSTRSFLAKRPSQVTGLTSQV